jgi:serine/threonine-protein kinase
MTQAGAILGTAAYMSPEQAKGKVADRRADVWSFGIVLYELLAGKKLFGGESVVEILGGVLNKDPDLSATPARVHKLLRWCLEKDRKQRLQAIGDARRLLLESGAESPAQATSLPHKQSRLPWGIAAASFIAAAALAFWPQPAPPERPLIRLDVNLGADVSLPAATPGVGSVAISPDGMRLAYVSGTPTRLFTRRLDQPKATEFAGTQGAIKPVFSPDGQWIVFQSANKLVRISVEGGAVVPLGDLANLGGLSWEEDGSLLVSEALGKGLFRIPAAGGPIETVAELSQGELALHDPQVLPGGKAVLFSVFASTQESPIQVLTLADGKRKTVGQGFTARFIPASEGAPEGHLIYLNKSTLFAVPFNLDKLETRGTAVPVLDDVAIMPTTGTGQFVFSRTGTFVYRRVSGRAGGMTTLQWVDPSGKREPAGAKPGAYENPPSLSPDGKRVALTLGEQGSQDIWVYDPQRDSMTRLTFGGSNLYPLWSPDGGYVVYWSLGKGILQTRADGASQPQPLLQSAAIQIPRSFTPDGKRLAYFEVSGNPQIWTVPLEDQGGTLKGGKPEQFLKSSFVDTEPRFSPDGRWLAYQSTESGMPEVYVRAFPPLSSGQGGKWQISNAGGTAPRWSRSGQELVYQSGDQLMTASYTVQGDTFVAGKPRVWIQGLGSNTLWDLAPDGKRVIALLPVETTQGTQQQDHEVVVLFNFFDELRRKAPLGK